MLENKMDHPNIIRKWGALIKRYNTEQDTENLMKLMKKAEYNALLGQFKHFPRAILAVDVTHVCFL